MGVMTERQDKKRKNRKAVFGIEDCESIKIMAETIAILIEIQSPE